MIGGVEPAALQQFRTLVADRLGLDFDDSKLDELADVLRQRLSATRSPTTTAYLQRLSSAPASDELRAVAEHLTVGETYFFRNPAHFRAFVDRVLRPAVEQGGPSRRLNLLSAGCASGEEAHTLAILLREHVPDPDSWARIVAVDVNRASMEKGKRGRYSSWSLRATAPEAQERWFRKAGQEFCLDDRVRALVSFEERNILVDDPEFWSPERFDAIFCRNVFIYLTPEAIRSTVARFSRSLVPGGLLFLGDAETLRGLSHEFHLCHTHDTFYYQRREPGADQPVSVWAPPAGTAAPASASSWPAASSEPFPLGNESWLTSIQHASDRIAALAARSATPTLPAPDGLAAAHGFAEGGAPSPGAPAAARLDQASDLFRQERFTEAMEVLQAMPGEAQTDPDVQILHAIILTNRGQVDHARTLCERVLALDEFNAGAHYLMALCCEHSGDTEAAREHDRIAIYLEPAFAMARLHLGLMTKRAGDAAGACRELTHALDLLGREDASRILLFGGGFNREALLRVCRAEIKACGGTA